MMADTSLDIDLGVSLSPLAPPNNESRPVFTAPDDIDKEAERIIVTSLGTNVSSASAVDDEFEFDFDRAPVEAALLPTASAALSCDSDEAAALHAESSSSASSGAAAMEPEGADGQTASIPHPPHQLSSTGVPSPEDPASSASSAASLISAGSALAALAAVREALRSEQERAAAAVREREEAEAAAEAAALEARVMSTALHAGGTAIGAVVSAASESGAPSSSSNSSSASAQQAGAAGKKAVLAALTEEEEEEDEEEEEEGTKEQAAAVTPAISSSAPALPAIEDSPSGSEAATVTAAAPTTASTAASASSSSTADAADASSCTSLPLSTGVGVTTTSTSLEEEFEAATAAALAEQQLSTQGPSSAAHPSSSLHTTISPRAPDLLSFHFAAAALLSPPALSPHMNGIVPSAPDPQAGCMGKLFPARLPPPLAPSRDAVFALARCPFDPSFPSAVHTRLMTTLYHRLMGAPPIGPGASWQNIGFQRDGDFSTDLRGGGMLGPLVALYLLDCHPTVHRQLWALSRDPLHPFPYMLQVISLTGKGLAALRYGRLNGLIARVAAALSHWEQREGAGASGGSGGASSTHWLPSTYLSSTRQPSAEPQPSTANGPRNPVLLSLSLHVAALVLEFTQAWKKDSRASIMRIGHITAAAVEEVERRAKSALESLRGEEEGEAR